MDAVDVSSVALEHGANRARELDLSVNWIEADLDDYRFDNGPYQLIVVARFLNRNMMPSLLNALADGGYLIYETHLQSAVQGLGGPSSERFRLSPQELCIWLTHYASCITSRGLRTTPTALQWRWPNW